MEFKAYDDCCIADCLDSGLLWCNRHPGKTLHITLKHSWHKHSRNLGITFLYHSCLFDTKSKNSLKSKMRKGTGTYFTFINASWINDFSKCWMESEVIYQSLVCSRIRYRSELGSTRTRKIFPTAPTLIWHFYNFYLFVTDLLKS